MKYKLFPNRVRNSLIARVLFAEVFIFALPLIMESNSSLTDAIIMWRYPMLLLYGVLAIIVFYITGLFGSCSFSYDGITFKRSIKEYFVLWSDVDKVVSAKSGQYLEVQFKPEHKKKYKRRKSYRYSFEKNDEVIAQIRKYFSIIEDE